MKALLAASCAVGVAVILGLAGCGQKSATPANATNTTSNAGNPLDAPGDYLRGMAKGEQSAVKTVDTASINQAIQLFNVDQGRNPKDLNELVEKKYLPKIPDAPYGMKIAYDATAGTVKVVKQ